MDGWIRLLLVLAFDLRDSAGHVSGNLQRKTTKIPFFCLVGSSTWESSGNFFCAGSQLVPFNFWGTSFWTDRRLEGWHKPGSVVWGQGFTRPNEGMGRQARVVGHYLPIREGGIRVSPLRIFFSRALYQRNENVFFNLGDFFGVPIKPTVGPCKGELLRRESSRGGVGGETNRQFLA